MKVYNKEGQSMNADKDQVTILLDSGWSTTKPELKSEPVAPIPVKKVRKIPAKITK